MRIVRLKTEEGTCTAIMGEPMRIYTAYVLVELPRIRLRRMPNGDVAKYTTDITYPLKKACRRYLSFGKQHDITKSARTFLRGALA